MAAALQGLGTREAFVVCGKGTYDEISICGPTRISHLKDGEVATFVMKPEDYGFEKAQPEDIRGGNARVNADIIVRILQGEKGPKRDMVVLNAAACFVAVGRDDDFTRGIKRAQISIDSGNAAEKLDELVQFTQGCSYFVRKDLYGAA
jgi:anthranilate phosphoribosyltransferase